MCHIVNKVWGGCIFSFPVLIVEKDKGTMDLDGCRINSPTIFTINRGTRQEFSPSDTKVTGSPDKNRDGS